MVSPTCLSPQISDKTETGIFLISAFLVKSHINKNCHNSRTSDDIYMKLGPITKLAKKNAATSKKFDDDVLSINYDFILSFRIYGQFGGIWKPDSGRMFYNPYTFINSNLLSYKN